MDKNVLLVGRKAIVLDDVREGLAVPDVTLFSATTLNEVRKVFGEHPIDTVIMGAGIDLDTRLRIVRHVFEASDSTTVHMKDWQSGHELPPVRQGPARKTGVGDKAAQPAASTRPPRRCVLGSSP
jgi:hypothetical protein